VLFPGTEHPAGGHWLLENELELRDGASALDRRDLEMLIEEVCSVPGNSRGTNPPHPESPMGKVHAKLLLQLETLSAA
jgi:hypothetical protein